MLGEKKKKNEQTNKRKNIEKTNNKIYSNIIRIELCEFISEKMLHIKKESGDNLYVILYIFVCG